MVSVAGKKRYVRNIAAGIAETRLPTGFEGTGIDRTWTATPCNYILAARAHRRAARQRSGSGARIIPWNLGDIREGRGWYGRRRRGGIRRIPIERGIADHTVVKVCSADGDVEGSRCNATNCDAPTGGRFIGVASRGIATGRATVARRDHDRDPLGRRLSPQTVVKLIASRGQ